MSVIICNRVDKGPHRQEVGVGKVDAGERELGAHHRPREAQGGVQRVLVAMAIVSAGNKRNKSLVTLWYLIATIGQYGGECGKYDAYDAGENTQFYSVRVEP
eukprot:1195848-Prorocentrum_minimum.AAC.3